MYSIFIRYYSCDNPKCEDRYKSFCHGSVLKDVRLELNKFLMFLLLLVAQCTNSVIITLTGHDDKTIRKYRDIVLKAVIYDMEHTPAGVFAHTMIGGVGIEVQVDESKFGVRFITYIL